MNIKKLKALIKGLNKLLDDLEDNKAPRTGFKKPTEKEERDFGDLLESIKHTAPQSFFHCPIHKKTKLTKFRSKKGNGQVCTKCNPKLIK